ncbi:MAG TPA: hypothetical protein VLG92_01625 [Candidatus Saccharimonadia bacterium]|nr:hypothetical protein [Candidatus Saccharimonadia bacterium]
MGSKDLDVKISNFMHRKEREFPGLSLVGGRYNRAIRHASRQGHEVRGGGQRPSTN